MGRSPAEDRAFPYLEDFAFDSKGNLLIADALEAVVYVFTPQGELVTRFGAGSDGAALLVKPEGVAVDAEGFIYVSDYHHVATFTSFGTELGQTSEVEFMCIAPNGPAVPRRSR